MAAHELNNSPETDDAFDRLVDQGRATYSDRVVQPERLDTQYSISRVLAATTLAPPLDQIALTEAKEPLQPELDFNEEHDRKKFKEWLAALADADAQRKAAQFGVPINAIRRARNLPIPGETTDGKAS